MEQVRILIAMNNDASIAKLKAILTEHGYMVVDYVKDGNECLRKIRVLGPDIVILDHALPQQNGWEVSKIVIGENICDVILITSDTNNYFMDEMSNGGSFVRMPKPINKLNLINTIDILVKSRRKIMELEKEVEELRLTLDTRKEVEKAKGLLMKYMQLSEQEAFKRIQKQSMDKGIAMKEIAKAIILAYNI